jgi:hypothetical protein
LLCEKLFFNDASAVLSLVANGADFLSSVSSEAASLWEEANGFAQK